LDTTGANSGAEAGVLAAAAGDDLRSATSLGSDDDATVETGSEAGEEADAVSAECLALVPAEV
jgi:hypothetical protein